MREQKSVVIKRLHFKKIGETEIIREVCKKGSIKFNGKKFLVYRNEKGIFLPINQDKILLQKVFWKRLFTNKETRKGKHYAISYWDISEIFPEVGGYISNDIIFLWNSREKRDREMKQVIMKIMELW